jgi:hypothetical protein
MNHPSVTGVERLMTKYFYRDKQLCFQILLALQNGQTVVASEHLDYAEYRKQWQNIQTSLRQNAKVWIPEQSGAMAPA